VVWCGVAQVCARRSATSFEPPGAAAAGWLAGCDGSGRGGHGELSQFDDTAHAPQLTRRGVLCCRMHGPSLRVLRLQDALSHFSLLPCRRRGSRRTRGGAPAAASGCVYCMLAPCAYTPPHTGGTGSGASMQLQEASPPRWSPPVRWAFSARRVRPPCDQQPAPFLHP
jgi:hypothetical protein